MSGQAPIRLHTAAAIAVMTAQSASDAPTLSVPSPKHHGGWLSMTTGRQTVVSPRLYSARFHLALSTLSEHGVALDLAGRALQLWHHLCTYDTPPEPIIEPTVDGGLRYAWSTIGAYLDVQVYADGTTEWFFEDRGTGKVAGTQDERGAALPPTFFRYLSYVKLS